MSKAMFAILLFTVFLSVCITALESTPAKVVKFPQSDASRAVVDLQISWVGDNSLQLTWSEVSGATGYKIYHADTPDAIESSAWTVFAELPAGTSSLPLTPPDAHGFYFATYLYSAFQPPAMAYVQRGTFTPWTNYNVTLSSFYIGVYELTQPEYTAIMNESPFEYPSVGQPAENVSWFNVIEYCNRLSIHEGLTPCYSYSTYGTNPDNWPVGWDGTNANHLNVNCNWEASGFRLPTEMEWMFAAIGGNLTHGYLFSGSDNPYDVCWFAYNNYPYGPKPVGTLSPNELGTFDQTGNVYEWVWDMYSTAYPTGNVTNPTGPTYSLGRTLRGGYWALEALTCTVRSRESDMPVNHSYGLTGFRICRRQSS